MTETCRQLLAEIIANPDEDTPRVVYADAIEEAGDADRAAFIRAQVELALRPHGQSKYRHALVCRRNGRGVLVPGYPLPWPNLRVSHVRGEWESEESHGPTVRRGFVEAVTCSAEDWLRHADHVRRQHPVTRVTLTTDPGGYWEGDSATDEATYVLPGYSRTVTAGEAHAAFHADGWRSTGHPSSDILGVLWPGIEFALPPAFDTVNLTAYTITGLAHVTPELLNDAATGLGVPPHVANPSEYGVEQWARSGDAPLVPAGDRVEWVDQVPVTGPRFIMTHQCPELPVRSLFTRDAPPSPLDIVFDRIECGGHTLTYNATRPPTRYRLHAGRCPRCSTSFLTRPIRVPDPVPAV